MSNNPVGQPNVKLEDTTSFETPYEVITPDSDRLRSKSSKGENYEKPVAHYSKFGSALNKVAECQLHNSKENFDSVSKYLDRWDEVIQIQFICMLNLY